MSGGRPASGHETQKMHPVDAMVRAVSLSEARERNEFIWREINAALLSQSAIRRTLYFDALLKSARLVLAKLEDKGDFTDDLWTSYRQLIGHCLLSFGTVEMPKLLKLYEDIVKAVLRFPSGPVGLVNDYKNCVAAQREQFQLSYMKQQYKRCAVLEVDTSDIGALIPPPSDSRTQGKDTTQREGNADTSHAAAAQLPPRAAVAIPPPARPDLEYKEALTAAVPTLSSEDMLKALNDLPTRMCFAHRNGILHMKLMNPLAIPPSTFVTTGYGCDTCKLQGLHIAYQAMLYDTAEEEEKHPLATKEGESADGGIAAQGSLNVSCPPPASAAPKSIRSGDVRSNAQIAGKRFHGFDVCTACAVYFFLEQKRHLSRCFTTPHGSFALGHASGVTIASATYRQSNAHARQRTAATVSCDSTAELAHREASFASLPQTPPSLPQGAADRAQRHDAQPRKTSDPSIHTPTLARSASHLPAPCRTPAVFHQNSLSCPTVAPAPAPRGLPDHSSSPHNGVKPLSAPPARPPQRHRHCVASHWGGASSCNQCRRRSSGSSASSFASAQGPPLPPTFRASPVKSEHSASPTLSRSSTPCSQMLLPNTPRRSRVELTVSIAPYGARPIAWVLPEPAEEVAATAATASPAMLSIDAFLPPKDWRSRCIIHSDMTYKRAEVKEGTARSGHQSGAPPVQQQTSAHALSLDCAGGAGRRVAPHPTADAGSSLTALREGSGALAESGGGDGPKCLSATARPGTVRGMALAELLMVSSGSDASEDAEDEEETCSATRSNVVLCNRKQSKDTASVDDVTDVCLVCLASLSDDVPVIETRCHHFFHVECIEGFARMHEDTCPLCRCPNALPDLSLQSALQRNTFHITLRLTEEEAARESVTVCVGSILTRRGTFENIMSLSAATCVTVRRIAGDRLRGAQLPSAQPPTHPAQPARSKDK